MDAKFTVHARGVVYINGGKVVAVQDAAAARPAGFEKTPVVETAGTIFPGLIELHNHLSYNALRLWNVPQKYTNRDQWSKNNPEYQQLITGPMKVIGQTPTLLPALVRFVESKCLAGGVTTSQGIALASNAGARGYYKGIIRTVEEPNDKNLPAAGSHIADVAAQDKKKFLTELKKKSCLLLHLSEGTDVKAREHFQALQIKGTQWAITDALAGIHCAALEAKDFEVLAKHGGAMVWSPFSNLLLYGATANVQAAKKAGVRMAIGSDWSPSGSKNLLGELKVAHLYSQKNKALFSDRDIVCMATCNPASILHWDKLLGSLASGKYADLLTIDGTSGDPYSALVAAKETAIRLVMIQGEPRYGDPVLMKRLGASGESLKIGGKARTLHVAQAEEDKRVAKISLADAKSELSAALKKLPQLSKTAREFPAMMFAARAKGQEVWSLALDELEDTGVDMRPRLPLPGEKEPTGADRLVHAAIPETLQPLHLDGFTVADDGDFLKQVSEEKNLPAYLGPALKRMYS
jgi:cytosine/adenosine deaminase-related metal-dependent hydrolase